MNDMAPFELIYETGRVFRSVHTGLCRHACDGKLKLKEPEFLKVTRV